MYTQKKLHRNHTDIQRGEHSTYFQIYSSNKRLAKSSASLYTRLEPTKVERKNIMFRIDPLPCPSNLSGN